MNQLINYYVKLLVLQYFNLAVLQLNENTLHVMTK